MLARPHTLAINDIPSDDEEACTDLHYTSKSNMLSPGMNLFNRAMTPQSIEEGKNFGWSRTKNFVQRSWSRTKKFIRSAEDSVKHFAAPAVPPPRGQNKNGINSATTATLPRQWASSEAISVATNYHPRASRTIAPSGMTFQRRSINRVQRRSCSRLKSPVIPNYTQHACALADKEFENDEVTSAQEIFEELLDTPSGRDFVNLQAAVLRARKYGVSRIEMQRESVDVPWGVIFFKPSQLEALGWKSDLVNGSQSHLDVVSLFSIH